MPNENFHTLRDTTGLRGQAHDMKGVAPLIEGVDFDVLLADKAFDADWLLAERDTSGATAIIPPKANRKVTRDYDKKCPQVVASLRKRLRKGQGILGTSHEIRKDRVPLYRQLASRSVGHCLKVNLHGPWLPDGIHCL
jgi:hypothetical protein